LLFLGERKPFYEPIAKIATLAEKEKLIMVVSPISFATVNYFLAKFENGKIAREKLLHPTMAISNCLFSPTSKNPRGF